MIYTLLCIFLIKNKSVNIKNR
ncbi:MAG: hypothetical protein Q614_SASC00228G0002, partial [Staphylococcus sp. DORA_6_22]